MATIVIAEDEEGLRELMQTFLEGLGYTVIGAANGKQALELVKQTNPALVISDVMMPVMDGYTLLENIRRTKRWEMVKVILISAVYISRQGHFQADRYANKPFDLDELESLIGGLIGDNHP